MFAAIHSALKALEKIPTFKEHDAYIHLSEIFLGIEKAKNDKLHLDQDLLIKDFALLSFYLLLEYLYATSTAAKEYLRSGINRCQCFNYSSTCC